MRTKVTDDDDNFQYVRASLNTQEQEENKFNSSDPFNKNWEELQKYSGLDQNFRRRVARQVSKAITPNEAYLDSANAVPSGADAGSKARPKRAAPFGAHGGSPHAPLRNWCAQHTKAPPPYRRS